MRRLIPLLLIFLCSAVFAQATVTGPATAKAGGHVEVTVTGSKNPRDFVTIVEKGAREGSYGGYEYVTKPGAYQLVAPPKAGEYEIRLCAADSPHPPPAPPPPPHAAVGAPGCPPGRGRVSPRSACAPPTRRIPRSPGGHYASMQSRRPWTRRDK